MNTPWTIATICEALGNPLSKRFLAQISEASAHQLLSVFAKWERVAEDVISAVERGRQIVAAEERGEDPTADWPDMTSQSLREAERIRSRKTVKAGSLDPCTNSDATPQSQLSGTPCPPKQASSLPRQSPSSALTP